MNNIKYVLDKHMCSGCGICEVICPKSCIKINSGQLVNYPMLDDKACSNCGLCLQICPGNSLIKRIKENKCNDLSNEGNLRCKVCYSNDNNIRLNAASGGIVTNILIYLLENKIIDGAICVKQDGNNPILNEVYIAKTNKEILLSMGSRYSPVSNCIVLKEVLKNGGKYAFVGKPCEIEALSNYESKYPKVTKNIFIKIGIMCHHTPTREGLKDLARKYNFRLKDVEKLKFRGNGWPGYFKVSLKNNKTLEIPYFDAWGNHLSKYVNPICKFCDNPLAQNSDITVGDPWGEEYKNETKGMSAIIIRSDLGNEIINQLEHQERVTSKDIKFQDIKRFQIILLSRIKQAKINGLAYEVAYDIKYSMLDIINACGKKPVNYLKLMKKIYINKKSRKYWSYK